MSFFHIGHHYEWKGLIMMTNRGVQTGFELYVSEVFCIPALYFWRADRCAI